MSSKLYILGHARLLPLAQAVEKIKPAEAGWDLRGNQELPGVAPGVAAGAAGAG